MLEGKNENTSMILESLLTAVFGKPKNYHKAPEPQDMESFARSMGL